MKKAMLSILLLLAALSAAAQDQPEYRAEIGGGIGMVNYLGDMNGNLLKDVQPMAALTARYRMNPRMCWALNIGYGKLKGSQSDVQTYYPDLQGADYSFSNPLLDVGIKFEYNFWPYGTGREYRGARRFTPYIGLGLGMTYVSADKGVFTANVPIGLGVKYKLGHRTNLGAEWVMHFSLSDKLDGVQDPYGIKSTGIFKNTDCYGTLLVSISYDLWPKCRTCHNDRD